MGFSLTVEARDDLIDIYATGCRLFGLHQADAYQDSLEAVFAFLSEHPRSARERVELSPPVRIHPCRSHVVIYQMVGDDIVVLRVRHGHENWSAAPMGFHEEDDTVFER